jgi:general secretion pathway protein D
MQTVTKLFVLAGLAVLPFAAPAQFDFGGGSSTPAGGSSSPWQGMKLDPKARIKLDYRNASVDMILQMYQRATGITIVKDPSLTDRLSVTSASAVSLADALTILRTTLGLKGYDLVREGNLLVIKRRQERQQNPGQNQGFDPSQFAQMMGGPERENELKVYPIKFANSSQVARVVNEVFANQEANQNPFGGMFPGGGGGMQFQFGGQGGQGGRGRGMQGGNPFARFGRGASMPTVRASSDEFSNSVVVNAPRDKQREVQNLIRELDKQTEQPQQSRVFRLTYSTAAELAPVVQNVLVSNAPRGRGGIGAQQNVNPFERFQQAARFGTSSASFGQVVADDRTNSLVVTATEENLATIDKVIKELDTEVKLEAGTFVFNLKNARADDISNLLGQAFGSRQTGGQFNNRMGGNFNQNRNNQNRNNQNRNNPFGGNNNQGLRGSVDVPGNAVAQNNELPVELADPNAESGELLTRVGVAQAFGGGFFGQPQRGAQTGAGRDAQGRVTNVQDLTNQVTVIPDVNTNSVIVVTTPENARLIEQILAQLDKIPEQVMIETLIVEASLDASTRFGVEWNFIQNNVFNQPGATGEASTVFPDTTNDADTGFRYSITGGKLETIIQALQSDTKFEVLSTPRIFTSNNVQAQINISQSVPYVLSSREDANGNLTFNYAFEDVGIVLTVTPRITSNGYVTMDVTQTANDLQGFTSFNAPIVNQRQADTTVSVRDGETVVLGGIIRSTVTSTVRKVPILGDIPILGEIFKSTSKGKTKTELLVFLTPRIVRDPDDAKLLRERTESELNPRLQRDLNRRTPPGGGTTPPPNNQQNNTQGS